jgi:hypothetical protein
MVNKPRKIRYVEHVARMEYGKCTESSNQKILKGVLVVGDRLILQSMTHEQDAGPLYAQVIFKVARAGVLLTVTITSVGYTVIINELPIPTYCAIEVRSPTEAKGFSCSLCVQTGTEAHPASCPIRTGGKGRPRHDADHSPPSRAEVVNE